jgi:hypothetical protein
MGFGRAFTTVGKEKEPSRKDVFKEGPEDRLRRIWRPSTVRTPFPRRRGQAAGIRMGRVLVCLLGKLRQGSLVERGAS